MNQTAFVLTGWRCVECNAPLLVDSSFCDPCTNRQVLTAVACREKATDEKLLTRRELARKEATR